MKVRFGISGFASDRRRTSVSAGRTRFSTSFFSKSPLVVSPLVVARIADLAGSETVPGSLAELVEWRPSKTVPPRWPADPDLLDMAAALAAAAEKVAETRRKDPGAVTEDPEKLLIEAEALVAAFEFGPLAGDEVAAVGITGSDSWCGPPGSEKFEMMSSALKVSQLLHRGARWARTASMVWWGSVAVVVLLVWLFES